MVAWMSSSRTVVLPVKKQLLLTAAYHTTMKFGPQIWMVFNSVLAAGKHWRRQEREWTTIDGKKLDSFTLGSFIATASMIGHIVNVPHIQAAYNVSKAGVIHLCEHTKNIF